MVQKSIDFSIYGGEPVSTGMHLLQTIILDPKVTLDNVLNLREHNIETEDSIL